MTRRGSLVFGGTDGLVLILGLVLGLVVSRQPAASVWHAGLGGGLAEFSGMALGDYWSGGDRDLVRSALNGFSCCVAVVISALPFLLCTGTTATVTSLVVISVLAAAISWLRDEPNLLSVAETFGLLLLAAGLSAASGLL